MVAEPTFGDPIGPWFRWFAWHPTHTTDRGWRWLRVVWRRHYQTKDFLSGPTHQWFCSSVEDPRPISTSEHNNSDGGNE